ncbi:hypothetical protein LguiB_026764 [Lonicera macranthoides]
MELMQVIFALMMLFSAFWQPFWQTFRQLTNIKRMRSQFERLECMKRDVQLTVDEAKRNNEIVGHLVTAWMKRVQETEACVNEIMNDSERVGKGCFNIVLRHKLDKIANKITQDIIELLSEGRFDRVSYPAPPSLIERAAPAVAETLVFEDQGDGLSDAAYALLQLCRRFTFAEMQSATQNFNDQLFIGKGGFGRVYKGFINNGATAVAIKRLDPMSSQGGIEFHTEIEMLSRFRHCNLVSLMGYCHEGREMVLVYEYMPNGSMADHLHPKDGSRNGNSSTLSWVKRLKICIGAARGIDYLHTGTGVLEKVIHRDVKTSNILLDANWAAKVSDFGLCKLGPANQSRTHISTRVKGTPGYCDPEYLLTHRLTKKSDVYAFGVVLFEVLSGKPALDFSLPQDQRSLAKRAQKCIQENTTHRLIDTNLKWEISSNSLEAFVEIAGRCLQIDSKKRPKMVEVVASLEMALTLQSSKDSALLDDDIFDFGGTSDYQEKVQSEVINAGDFKQENIVPADSALDASEAKPKDEQGLQNQDRGVDDDYKVSSGIEDKIGGRKAEIDSDVIRWGIHLLDNDYKDSSEIQEKIGGTKVEVDEDVIRWGRSLMAQTHA